MTFSDHDCTFAHIFADYLKSLYTTVLAYQRSIAYTIVTGFWEHLTKLIIVLHNKYAINIIVSIINCHSVIFLRTISHNLKLYRTNINKSLISDNFLIFLSVKKCTKHVITYGAS